MTPISHWGEQDSNSNAANQHSTNSNSAFERGNNSWASGKSSGNQGESETRDIEGEAAAHLLTKQEKLLCLQLDLKPTQYLTQKALLLQVIIYTSFLNYIHLSIIAKKFLLMFLLQEYLNGNKRSNIVPQSEPESKILHYLVANGWIAAN